MLFELRNSVPVVSPAWNEARDLFLRGQVKEAWEIATQMRGNTPLETANDYLLNIEIARACMANKTYLALARMAYRLFRNEPIVQLYHARVLLTRSLQTEGIDYLLGLESTLGQTHRALWGTELANMYASAGFAASSRRWLDRVQNEPGIDSPLALYSQSCAQESIQQWDSAIDFAQRCVAAAPDWTRARSYLASCLLARGEIEAAEQQFAEVAQRGHEEAAIEIAAAMLSMSLGKFAEAKTQLKRLLVDWPQAEFFKWAKRTLCILLVELGEYDAAKKLLAGEEKRFAIPAIPDAPSGRHCFIPLPVVAQNRNQCVPTSMAMAVYPQGQLYDPDTMFQEMHGREGTPLWRMREWAEEHGFQIVPIRLEKDAVVAMLDVNIPLIGVLEGAFNSHVDVICGYNDDLETLYVRDPGHWAPMAYPWEMALKRYEMHNGLFAVIQNNREDILNTAKSWWSEECAALLDLSQAVAQGELAEAEAAFARIPDESPTVGVRDGYGVNMVISPKQFLDRMRVISQDEEANWVARFRAVMSLGPDDSEGLLSKLLEDKESDQFGVRSRNYLLLLKLLNDGNWTTARSVIDRLLVRGCGIAHFWDLKSDVLAELGEHDASKEALDRAIELEPLRLSTREKALKRNINHLTLKEYLSEFDALLAEDPDDKRLLLGRAAALQDGPDGKEFERAARDAIRWFPRYPDAYSNLLNWYHIQGREDLTTALLTEAHAMLPEDFVNPAERAAANQNPQAVETADAEQNGEAKSEEQSAEPSLPEEKHELLALIWQPSNPLREQALAKVLEHQQSEDLHWYEVARLNTCRLLIPDEAGQALTDPAEILLDSPPGPAHWFADLLCDVLTEYEPSIRTSLAVIEWMERVVPNYSDYPQLWFKRVLLTEHAKEMERALEELRSLLEKYPAMSSALYRMGVVKYRQQDYPTAQSYFEKSLEVNPGLFGAVDNLRNIHDILGQPEQALQCIKLLRTKMPYAVSFLRDEVLATSDLFSPDAAEEVLDAAAEDFPQRRIDVLRSRIYFIKQDLDQAAALLSKIELRDEDDEDSFEETLRAKIALAMEQNDSAEILQLCETGLRRWPDSTRLKELQAEQFAITDPEKSKEILRELLHQGEPGEETVWQYLNLFETEPHETARQVILDAPEARQQDLAELFARVMTRDSLLSWCEPFLKWGLETYPESDDLRWRLASHYNINGMVDQAVIYAKQLHERNPDNPEAVRMLGRCLMEKDAKAALKYLEQVCAQNNSVDYLFDLARCHSINGNRERSNEIHWEILSHNPYASASWTNLYLTEGSKEKLWPLMLPMLERGYGIDDEYFLVAAVKLALDMKQPLPASWYPLAARRWSVLQTYPGYQDERQLLRRALLAWKARRPQDVNGSHPQLDGFVESMMARFVWPRLRWVAQD